MYIILQETCIKYPLPGFVHIFAYNDSHLLVRGARDSRATLMPIYGDLYQIKL